MSRRIVVDTETQKVKDGCVGCLLLIFVGIPLSIVLWGRIDSGQWFWQHNNQPQQTLSVPADTHRH